MTKGAKMILPLNRIVSHTSTDIPSATVGPETLSRQLRFIDESNRIEDIKMDLRDSEKAPRSGHFGAYENAYQLGKTRKPLNEKAICDWQAKITQESRLAGVTIPDFAIGRPMRIFIANQVLKSTLFMGTIYERVDDTDEYRAPSGQVVICKTNAIQKAITDWMTSESECGK
ncbi:hypothetical protein EBR96_04335 [bacterium]|nr:hypothetical protein [bacterium]